MIYNGIEIRVRKAGNFELNSPVNGTLRIFNTLEKAKYYIDHAFVIDTHAKGMME